MRVPAPRGRGKVTTMGGAAEREVGHRSGHKTCRCQRAGRPGRRDVLRGLGRRLAEERGVVFVGALLAVGVILALVTTVSNLSAGEARSTPYWRDRGEALYVAESGFNHCMWKLTYDRAQLLDNQAEYGVDPPTFTSDTESESAGVLPGNSLYEVWAENDTTDPLYWYVTIRAQVGDQSHLLRCRVKQVDNPFYDKDGSGDEEYPDPETEAVINYPNIPNGGTLKVNASDKKHLAPGEYLFDKIDIEGGGQLILDGDVTLWVKKSVKCTGSSWVNYVEDSMDPDPDQAVKSNFKLVIYMPPVIVTEGVVSQTVNITGDAHFNGFIYAPDASCKSWVTA